MSALFKVRMAGFKVLISGDDLAFDVTPASTLTLQQREFLKSHKAEIIGELQQERASNDNCIRDLLDDRHLCHECNHLLKKRCLVQKFKPVDDIPRRCVDFTGRR